MVGLNLEIGALCMGVRIYGDVWQSGTLEAFNMTARYVDWAS